MQTEDKIRRKAFKAASKETKPLFGEDGRVQGLLEKYDQEAEEDGMLIDDQGAVEEAKRKRQDDIRAKLRAGAHPPSAPRPPNTPMLSVISNDSRVIQS